MLHGIADKKKSRRDSAQHCCPSKPTKSFIPSSVTTRFTADVTCCKYSLVHYVLGKHMGIHLHTDGGLADPAVGSSASTDRNLKLICYWSDTSLDPIRVHRLCSRKCLANHFPGILSICRKVLLASLLQRMSVHFPTDYNYIPESFVRADDFFAWHHQHPEVKFFIVKPNSGSQGQDIVITNKVTAQSFICTRFLDGSRPTKLPQGSSLTGPSVDGRTPSSDEAVVQRYIDRPFLIFGRKCDLRCYVLVTSMVPLKVYFHNQGMVRVCSTDYEPPSISNVSVSTMHLANYAINIHAKQTTQLLGASTPSKYSFKTFNNILWKECVERITRQREEQGIAPDDPTVPPPRIAADDAVAEVWSNIHDIAVKTLLAAQDSVAKMAPFVSPTTGLSPMNGGCFEVLGFDIILDNDLRPWLLEVNHSPSWQADTTFDLELKERIVFDAMRMCLGHGACPSAAKHRLSQPCSVSNSRLGCAARRHAAATKKKLLSSSHNVQSVEEYGEEQEGEETCDKTGEKEESSAFSWLRDGALRPNLYEEENGFEQIFPTPSRSQQFRDIIETQQEVISILLRNSV